MDELSPAPGLVFGNEVLDALPIRRIVGGARGDLLEIALDVVASGFRQKLLPLEDDALRARLARQDVTPARGQILDVAPALDTFVREAARLVARGFLLFIDYGDRADTLYAHARSNGTLAAYRGGGIQDPLARLGEQDLTADVDWTCVEHAATSARLTSWGLITQERLLHALGIAELGLPDEVHSVAGATGLGSAFQAMAFSRGVPTSLPGF
jgi:SAM-dependent MidA family methyltransferase